MVDQEAVGEGEADQAEEVEEHEAVVVAFDAATEQVGLVLQVTINVIVDQRIRKYVFDSQVQEETCDQEVRYFLKVEVSSLGLFCVLPFAVHPLIHLLAQLLQLVLLVWRAVRLGRQQRLRFRVEVVV